MVGSAVIVAASLLLSGGLTWFLVRRLETAVSQQGLNQEALAYRARVNSDFRLLKGAIPHLPTDPLGARLLLVDSSANVADDSTGASIGEPVQLLNGGSARFAVSQGTFDLDGVSYQAAWVQVGLARGPKYELVVAKARNQILGAAAGDLVGNLFLAGGVALGLAIAIALFLSRALTRPLRQLARASEEIAAGHYSTRVAIGGSDEVGVVGEAFNRMAEAVERARGLQREFLANASHELKTPLTSLIGFSQALTDGSLPTARDRERAAQIVHEEAERVLRLSQELLDLARVESGQMPMHPEPVDLGSLLRQEVDVLQPRAKARGLGLEVGVPPDLPPVRADPERLHQILDNLLDNAVKYAPEGSTIGISAAAVNGTVETAVDNPLGRYPPDPRRIFDRFYRAEPSRSTAAGGVGLGLAISRELAQAQGGGLWADFGTPGRLRMRLTLPAERDLRGTG